MGKQGIALEHHADAPALCRNPVQQRSIQLDGSFIRGLKACDQAQCRAFATSAWTKQRNALPRCNLQVESSQNPLRSETLSKIGQVQHQPFTAPLVRPATICRWHNSTISSKGMDPKTVAAA